MDILYHRDYKGLHWDITSTALEVPVLNSNPQYPTYAQYNPDTVTFCHTTEVYKTATITGAPPHTHTCENDN